MRNHLESLEPINVNSDEIINLEQKLGFTIPQKYREIIKKYNVCKPRYSYYNKDNIEFNLNFFFGFSENRLKDIFSVYGIYKGRMPKELFPVGSVDGGDLLCMEKENGNIYFWFHEENDRGIEGIKTWPKKISSNINDFLSSLIASEDPTKEEIDRVQKEGKINKLTPIALKLINDSRMKKGLPPLSMEEALKL